MVEYSWGYLLFISHIFDDLFLNWLSTRVYIHESQGPRLERNFRHCQRAKTWWTWRVISIIAENKPRMLITRLICIQLSPTRRDSYPQLPRSLLATPGSMTSLWRAHTKKKKEQRNACILRVSLIKQERLITIPYLGVHALDFSSQNNCMRHS